MSHVRKQIRDAAVAALTSIGGVYPSRTVPMDHGELPAILVYTNSEEVGRSTVTAYMRTLDLVVEIVADGRFVDDDLDAKVVSVETLLNGSKLGDLCKPLAPVSIAITVDTQGSTPVGRARMTYRCIYFTDIGNPETAV